MGIPEAGRAQGKTSRAGRSKYRAVRCEAYGRLWASKAELRRYHDLLTMGHAGALRNLELQPRFILTVNGMHVGRYTPDFRYDERCLGRWHCGLMICPGGHWIDVVEEVKGFRTRDYLIRRELFKALFPQIVFREVR